MFYRLLISAFLSLILLASAHGAADQDDGHTNDDRAEEVDEIIVQATRSRRRVQDEPIRVEVLSQEEIEETGGLRVQVTSPALGSANVRIYGMRGRYTQLLADGLPLYGGQASSLGLLQVPPSDLGQVEIIKGSASALYGGQSLGGVINLVSRRPGANATGEVILNWRSHPERDHTGCAGPLSLRRKHPRQRLERLDACQLQSTVTTGPGRRRLDRHARL
jgi:outer membrane receptor protein involved in Fe transport